MTYLEKQMQMAEKRKTQDKKIEIGQKRFRTRIENGLNELEEV